jgi:hypothetical protein
MVGWDVLRNTSKDLAVVDDIAAMAENAGALCEVFWGPWHLRHVASANRFPAAGSPTCWPKAKAMLARRSGALHANERTGIIWRSLRREHISRRSGIGHKSRAGQIRQPRPELSDGQINPRR